MTKRNLIFNGKEDRDLHLDPERSSKTIIPHTIKGRIFFLLLVVLIPILLTQAYIFYENFKNSREQAFRSNLEVARTLEKAFDAFIQGIFRQELAIGLAATASPPLSNQELKRILEKNDKDLVAVQRMTWIDPRGYSVVSSLPSPPNVNFADRKYFREILAGRECVVGDLVLSKAEKLPFFHVCRAIRDEKGTLLGVVAAAIDPEELDSVLAVERFKDAAVNLLDPQGMLVYRYPHLKQTWEERNWFKSMPVLEKSLREEVSIITIASYENEKRIFANIPIKSIGWSAGASIKENVVLEPIFTTLLYHGAAFSIIALLAFMAALIISRTISSSAERLRVHARVLGNGEYGRRIDLTGPAEMQELAQTFNAMAKQIDESHEELRSSEQRWATTLSSIGDAVIATDIAGKITFMNLVAEKLTGWTLREVSLKPVEEVFNIINEQTRQKAENPVAKVLEKGNIVGLANHTILVRKNGKEVPIDDSGAPIKDKDGKVTGVVLIFRDITERKKAERALRESEAKANALIQYAPTGIYEIDYRGPSFISVNDAMCQILGYTREELFLIRPSALLDENGRALFADRIRRQLAGEKIEESVEYRVRKKDGSFIDAILYVSLNLGGGEPGRALVVAYDVTERKRVEEQIRARENELRLVMDTVPGLISYLGPDFHYRRVNRGYEQWFGLEAREMEGRHVRDVLGEAAWEAVRSRLEQAMAGETVTYEERMPYRVGRRRWIAATLVPERDASGAVQGLVTLVTDITKRKRMEEALRRSENQYRSLFEGMTEGFALHEIICDERGVPCDYRFLDINPAFERLTGLKRESLIGKTVLEAIPGTEPHWIEKYGQVALTGKSVHFESYSGVLKKYYDVFAYSPAPRQFAVMFLDITDRRRGEEERKRLQHVIQEERDRLVALINSITDEVWFADVQKKFTLANPSALREFGIELAGNGIGVERFVANLEVYRPDGSPRPIEDNPALRALQGEVIKNQEEIVRTPATGELRYRQASSAPVRSTLGNIIGSVSVVRDITDRKRMEEELKKSHDELELRVRERTDELAKSQQRFQLLSSQLLLAQEKERKRVAVELHDGLLSELAAMKYLVEGKLLLLKEGKPSDLNEYKRVADILAIVMKEARGIMNNLHPSILDELGLISTINWLSEEYQKSYPHIKVQKQIEVSERDISDSVKVVIYRVLQEALNNFAKYGKGDLVELSLTKSGGTFAFMVRDNGQGFDVEKAQKGLGLESMRERVEISGGEFEIESIIGQGTTIRAIWGIS